MEFLKKILILVDTYGWAWDIAGRELLEFLPDIQGRTIDIKGLGDKVVDPEDYDIILAYPWAFNDIKPLPKDRTIIVIAGGEQLSAMDFFRKQCSEFKFYGACSKKIRKFLQQEFPKKKIFLLSHGVDTDLFSPLPNEHQGFSVGWAGDCKRKLKRFPLAQAIAHEAGLELTIAGFKSRPHSGMAQFYNSIDCLLVTSETEAHPLIVYEAMSCGVPVVTTDVGDVDEYIVNGINGFILPVDTSRIVFAEIIKVLKNNPALKKQMGQEGRKTVLNKLTWDFIGKQYTQLSALMKETKDDL